MCVYTHTQHNNTQTQTQTKTRPQVNKHVVGIPKDGLPLQEPVAFGLANVRLVRLEDGVVVLSKEGEDRQDLVRAKRARKVLDATQAHSVLSLCIHPLHTCCSRHAWDLVAPEVKPLLRLFTAVLIPATLFSTLAWRWSIGVWPL